MVNGIRQFQMKFLDSDYEYLMKVKKQVQATSDERVGWSELLLLGAKALDKDNHSS
jgi:hypothetical protein